MIRFAVSAKVTNLFQPARSNARWKASATTPQLVKLDYDQLVRMTPGTLEILRSAFVGRKSFGGIAIVNIPGYRDKRQKAFRAGINLALNDPKGRQAAAAVSNTYPGWSGTPGSETHPLQSSFLFNVKEEINQHPDPYFGKNVFPSEEYKSTWVDLATDLHDVSLHVLRGLDKVMEERGTELGFSWSKERSLEKLALHGPALAARFICYDSAFAREDLMLSDREADASDCHADVKVAGHAGDGLASMRTHSTPVKSAGHSTPVTLAVPSSDVLVSSRTEGGVSVRALATLVEPTSAASDTDFFQPPRSEIDVPDYWLPWHIDSNFLTIIHKEMYAKESDGSVVEEPFGAGVQFMNADGDIAPLDCPEDAMVLQFGGFGQIYTGGQITACRHAVVTPRRPGIARFNYCNFWYAQWETLCDAPPGLEHMAINKGWNAMMDESYLNISMKNGFEAFRKFMTSPEARVQFANTKRFTELAELIPMPAPNRTANSPKIIVDIMTDVRCPFFYIAKLKLEQAVVGLQLGSDAMIRYHPVFLNPAVPKSGECLDEYLFREYGYSKEFAHSKEYPLYQAGLEVGVKLNPDRRVVNTFDAFCLVALGERHGKQSQVVEALCRVYFEQAADISDIDVLVNVGEQVGLGDDVRKELLSVAIAGEVASRYNSLSSVVQEIPQFLVREVTSGNGVEVNGTRSVSEWETILQGVARKGEFTGMNISGLGGDPLYLASANPTSPVSLAMSAQHGWAPSAWPYSAHDFQRADESDDSAMYALPRFVSHLAPESVDALKEVYRKVFGQARPGFAVLDLCSSWTSHYPEESLRDAQTIAVLGMNELELQRNQLATENHVQDLNINPTLPWRDEHFDFVTLAMSVQYLTQPQKVFSEMHRVLKPGGMALVAFSNRCFIEKTVNVWAREVYDGEGHVHILRNYFLFSPDNGWLGISSADVSSKEGDPVWLVTAVKAGRS
jgi:predicted DsbA family dithiol-disulfide isomerase